MERARQNRSICLQTFGGRFGGMLPSSQVAEDVPVGLQLANHLASDVQTRT
jgi:hypothetical protein